MANILLVDDSEVARRNLKSVLEKNQYHVFECANGLEAIEFIKSGNAIDIIICDQNMPVLDGLSFCEILKRDHGHLNTSIVMLTTEVNAKMKEKAKFLGVRAWIIKPFDETKLINGLTTILKQTKSA